MYEFIFSLPWWVGGAITGVGVAVFVYANRRVQMGLRWAGVGIVLFAALWALVSYLVVTPTEQVAMETRRFVQAIVTRDASSLGELLDSQANAYLWNKQQIIDGADYYARQTGLTGRVSLGCR